ncbi:MAG: hypothetical protein AAFU80_08740 [Pseudomonadota bacterium]
MLRLLILTCALLASPQAVAHQPSDTLHRSVVVEHRWHRTQVTVRLPATLLFAPAAAARAHAAAPVEAPLLRAIRVGGGWDYRLDTGADPRALAPLIDTAVEVTVGTRTARLQRVRLLHRRDARAMGQATDIDLSEAHISEVLVEMTFGSRRGGPVRIAFPIDRTPLPPFVHLETTVEDRRSDARHWRIGPVHHSLELLP